MRPALVVIVAFYVLMLGIVAAMAQDGVTLSAAKDWLSFLTAGGVLLLAVLVLYLRTKFVPIEDIKALRTDVANDLSKEREARAGGQAGLHNEIVAVQGQVDRLEGRMLKAENELEHLPDKDVAHRLEMAIQRLEGKLETLDERLKPVAATSRRMEEFLLEEARK